MSITYPLAWPSHTGLTEITFREANVVGVTTAPFSGVQQVQEHQGKWWEAEASWPPLWKEEIDVWMGFFSSLHGMVGTFLLPDPNRTAPRGSAAQTPGTPQVDGAGQTGLALAIKTGLGTVTGYLKANDRFSLGTGAGRQLYKVLADVDLVSGNATIDIWPRLRTSPGDNDTIHLTDASGRFRLSVNSVEETRGRDGLYRLPPLTFMEALE